METKVKSIHGELSNPIVKIWARAEVIDGYYRTSTDSARHVQLPDGVYKCTPVDEWGKNTLSFLCNLRPHRKKDGYSFGPNYSDLKGKYVFIHNTEVYEQNRPPYVGEVVDNNIQYTARPEDPDYGPFSVFR